jgi:hypothetical protein
VSEESKSEIDIILNLDKTIKDVRIDSLDLSFNELADMYNNDELKINPEYQRLFRWSESRRSRFIESLLLELPIPPIFMIETDEGCYELLDGLQRISSYLHFTGQHPDLKESLVLSDCDIVEQLNGKTYRDLPKGLQLKLKRRYIRTEIIKKGSDPRLRYHIFKRLNTGGEILSDQEIRNCTIRLMNDRFNKFLIELSENEDFKLCISSVTDEKLLRKYDQELVLRLFAFKNFRTGFSHDISAFLDEFMENVSDLEHQKIEFDYTKEKAIFEKTFKVLRDTLGEYAFSRINERGNFVSGFIVYHYEAFALGIQKHLEEINPNDAKQMEKINMEFNLIKRDSKFRSITTGGGRNTQRYLQERIEFIENRMENII